LPSAFAERFNHPLEVPIVQKSRTILSGLMTLPIFFVTALILAASLLLISDKLRPDLVALLLLVTLGLTGLVDSQELFSGFSRAAVITIMALFIITDGLERTGATRLLGQQLNRLAAGNEARTVLVVMIATALLSLITNTIASAAVLLPAVIGISRQTRLRPSKLLIPLSFGALLGGMATLFTTANILVSAALAEQGLKPYGVLDFLPVGLPMAVAGIAFMVLVGRRLLPERAISGREAAARSGTLSDTYHLREAVTAVYVKPGSAMGGLSLAEGGWGERLGLNVVAISRGDSLNLAPDRKEEVLEGDVILFTGYTDDEELAHFGLIRTEDTVWRGQMTSGQVSLVEVVLTPRSSFVGKTLREIHFREKFDLSVLALWREAATIREGLVDIPLRSGDAILLQGRRSKIKLLREQPDFLVLEEDGAEIASPRKAWLAVGLTTAALSLAALNILPVAEASFGAAVLMILCRCLSMDEAYGAIEWKAIFLIAGMLPLGVAMTNTGTAAFLSHVLVGVLGSWGSLAVAGGIFLVTMLLTQVMSGQATAVVLAPIAIAAAQSVGADPRGLALAVALGCSTAFLTPISHPANMLVMGPGGYTFKDYSRVGLPLTALMFVVLLVSLALFWNIR
jgi:di/tricarboxylate transporter